MRLFQARPFVALRKSSVGSERSRRGTCLVLESLEDRCLPSASLPLDLGGLLGQDGLFADDVFATDLGEAARNAARLLVSSNTASNQGAAGVASSSTVGSTSPGPSSPTPFAQHHQNTPNVVETTVSGDPRPQAAPTGATLTVNTLTDEAIGSNSNYLSLREAIEVVNQGATTGLSSTAAAQVTGTLGTQDTIVFDKSLTGAINLTAELPKVSAVNDAIAINGPGVKTLSVDAQALGRVLYVQSGVDLSVSGLTLTNGLATNPGFDAIGGGIVNLGTLTLQDCAVTNNTVMSDATTGTKAEGGGIFSVNILTLVNTTISGNQAQGLNSIGAGIYGTGQVTVYSSTISGNTSTATTGSLTPAMGGGVSMNGVLTMINSTVSGNSVTGGSLAVGGGFSLIGGTTRLTNDTISANSADSSGGGIYIQLNSTAVFANNTIIAGNLRGAGSTTADDIAGTLQSTSSNNLIGTGGSGGLVNGTNGNLVDVADPGLGPLADNGGPTQTMDLLPGSVALNAGSNDLAVDAQGNPLKTDQTGDPRIVNGTVDIGARESQAIGAFFVDANNELFSFVNGVGTKDSGMTTTNFAIAHDAHGDPEVYFTDSSKNLWRWDPTVGAPTNLGTTASLIAGGNGEAFFTDASNNLSVYNETTATTTSLGASATLMALGGDATTGADVLYFLNGSNELFLYDGTTTKDLGAQATSILGGNGQVFFLDGTNQLFVSSQTGTVTSTGAFATPGSLSLGTGSDGKNELWFIDGSSNVWKYSAANGLANTGQTAKTVAAGNGEAFFIGTGGAIQILADDGTVTNTGASGTALSVGFRPSTGNYVFFLDGSNQIWLYENGTATNTGASGTRLVAF